MTRTRSFLGSAIAGLAFLTSGCRIADRAVDSALFAEYASGRPGTAAVLPDYSHAGYRECRAPLPDVTADTHTTFDVIRYGAVPDDGKSDRDALLGALADAHACNGPARITFPAGRFRLNEPGDLGKPPILIRRSDLVIQGAGAPHTDLFFAEPGTLGQALVSVRSDRPRDYYWRGGTVVAKLSGNASEDGFSVFVENAAKLRPGMVVNVDADLNVNLPKGADYFAPHTVPEGPKARHGGRNDYMFEIHRIAAVDGNRVTFAEPIHLDLPHLDNISLWSVDHVVREVGIEGLTLTGNHRGTFKHHNGPHFGEDYRMLAFEDAFDCWARDLRIRQYSSAISAWRSGFCTFANILLEDNPGHFSIAVRNSYGILCAYVREFTDSHHGLGVSGAAANTVFLRCVQYKNMEAHCGWARATLYDRNEGGFQTRGGGATFTPHHGKKLCFWNWVATRPGDVDFWPEGKRYGYFMPPIIAGLHGVPVTVADIDTDVIAWESPGQPVAPDSLFEAQLAQRLGTLPDWLHAESQRFEAISRHSNIAIAEPAPHSVFSAATPIPVRLTVPEELAKRHISRVELFVGTRNQWDDFRRIADTRRRLAFAVKPTWTGTAFLRARLTNSRGEVTTSAPVVVHVPEPGRPSELVPVARAVVLPGAVRQDLYRKFAALGGGEGRLRDSRALERQKANSLSTWQVAKAYREEQRAVYANFGRSVMSDALAQPEHVQAGSTLVDGNLDTTAPNLYNWLESMAQFELERTVDRLQRIDLVWKDRIPTRGFRLEVQTATDPDAWISVVNDEPIWGFSAVQVGGTLHSETLPGAGGDGRISSLYLPVTRCRYVRFLFSGFPNNALSEIRFLASSAAPEESQ